METTFPQISPMATALYIRPTPFLRYKAANTVKRFTISRQRQPWCGGGSEKSLRMVGLAQRHYR